VLGTRRDPPKGGTVENGEDRLDVKNGEPEKGNRPRERSKRLDLLGFEGAGVASWAALEGERVREGGEIEAELGVTSRTKDFCAQAELLP